MVPHQLNYTPAVATVSHILRSVNERRDGSIIKDKTALDEVIGPAEQGLDALLELFSRHGEDWDMIEGNINISVISEAHHRLNTLTFRR